MKRYSFLALLIVLVGSISYAEREHPLPWANPWEVEMEIEWINKAFDEVQAVIRDNGAPGAVGLVMKDGKIVARRALGNMQTHVIYRKQENGEISYFPMKAKMEISTLFDLASMTKMVGCLSSIMKLVEMEQLDIDKPVVEYIPSFGQYGKDQITVRQLLTHNSGLPSWFPFYMVCVNREEVFRYIDEEIDLDYKPGTKRIYSDVGFIVLGRLVEEISGERLDRFAKKHIFEPLGMDHTGYLPWLEERKLAAPTEFDPVRGNALQGIVHDENARALGGVSGHAGLFSTIDDLAIFCQMLLNKGKFQGTRIFQEKNLDLMLKPQLDEQVTNRGSRFLRHRRQLLGWWGMDERATLGDLGGLPSSTAYGHSGFTGTMLYLDPEHQAAAILLTNAVHPKRSDTQKSRMYRRFFVNVSKALVGEDNVNIEPEDE